MLITNPDTLSQFDTCHRVWQGIPGIARTKGGRTFISFYSGETAETYGNFAVVLKSDTDTDFSEPIAAARKPGSFRCFDPVLWTDPLGRLWFIWNVMPGEEVYASICEDPDADTLMWSEEFYIGRGVMMNKPIVLTTGEWLFPIAVWRTDIYPEFRKSCLKPGELSGAFVYKTSDNGKTFIRLGMADIRHRSFDEHMVIELTNGVLMMLVRTTYGIGVSYSYDRGKNWSTGEDSKLGGPCSRFYIGRLRSGRILLINHIHFTGRNNLTALLSEDDGKTFPHSLLLDERSAVSYPDAVEDENGFIYITYDRDRGCFKQSLEEAYSCAREVLTAKITEEDILHGQLVHHGSFLKNVVNKLGHLAPEDPNPYVESSADIETFLDSLLTQDGDVLEKVFARYLVNCIDFARLDMGKLDSLIDQFRSRGSNDRKLLLKIIDLLRFAPKAKPDLSPVIARIKAYVENHLAEDIPVSQIAEEMNMSVYYLAHLFKAVTGTTLVEFRNELRLTKAKQLLIHSRESISQIASQCGFASASYFTEIFTRSETIPPSEFRKYHAWRG